MQPCLSTFILKIPMKLDKQQKTAVDHPEKTMAISAGAGSGKTRVLVERYIRIVLDGLAEIDEILAITFTKKAASELKSRVRERLQEVFQSGKGEKKIIAEKALRKIDSAPISTIHSFCQSILKENAIEAGLEPNFRVLDSSESKIMNNEIISRLISNFLHTDDEDELFLIHSIKLNGLYELAHMALNDRYRLNKALETSAELVTDGLYNDTTDRIFENEYNSLSQQPEWINASENLSNCKPTDDSDRLAIIRQIVLNQFESLSEEAGLGRKFELLSSIRDSISLRYGKSALWKKGEKDIVKESLKTIREKIDDFLGVGKAEFQLMHSESIEKLLSGTLKLVGRLHKEFDGVMESMGALDYNGLLFKAMQLLSEQKNIAEQYNSQYKQILVDEFQDTDDIQMEIIRILVSKGKNRPVLFLVGDENQSIYKFRGAEVSNFRKMMKEVGLDKPDYLSTNYRSQPELIEFQNSFFRSLLSDNEGGYENKLGKMESHRKSNGEEQKIQLLMPVLEDDDEATIREKEADILASHILSIVGRKKTETEGEEEKFIEYRDIGILLRKVTQVQTILDKFNDFGIPYYFNTRKGFYDKYEIVDLLNLMRVIEFRRDDYSLASLLRSPIVGLSDNTLFIMGVTGSFTTAFNDGNGELFSEVEKEKFVRAKKIISDLREAKDRLNLSKFIQKIIDEINYIPFLLSSKDGEQKALNVYKLQEIVFRLEEGGVKTFGDLMEKLNRIQNLEISEGEAFSNAEGDDVVAIMTVHSAKGLQFPVVYLPDLNSTVTNKSRLFYYDGSIGFGYRLIHGNRVEIDIIGWSLKKLDKIKDISETRRLLYVSMTRAEDYLFFAGAREKKKETLTSPRKGSWLKEIMEGIGLDSDDETDTVQFNGLTIPIVKELKEVKAADLKKKPVKLSPEILKSTKYIEPIKAKHYPVRITPTVFMKYIECPKKYELSEIFGIEEPDKTESKSGKSEPASGKKFGDLAHKFLSQLKFQEEEFDSLIDKMLRKDEIIGKLEEKYADELKRIVERFRKTEIFQQLKSLPEESIKREENFFIEFDGVIIEGTIDLMYEFNERWNLLDYKTDVVDKDQLNKKLEHYKPQLLLYAKAIKDITNDYPLRTSIFFTRLGVEQELRVNDDSIAQVENQLRDMFTKLGTGDILKNPKSCDNCGYYGNYCKGA